MDSDSFEDIEALMFVYRELHLGGKVTTFAALHRLYKEIKHHNRWLDEEDLKRKDQILNSLALIVISNGLMVIEDFISLCNWISEDFKNLPSHICRYRKAATIADDLETKLNSKIDTPFYEMLSYLTESDLRSPELAFLSKTDKLLISKQHAQNVNAFKHTLRLALKTYAALSDPYNKYKHGFLFGFRISAFAPESMPEFAKTLGPMIPYFANPNNPTSPTPVFVGEFLLDKIDQLLYGGGSIFQLYWDITENVTIRCKYGGRKIIARKRYGEPVLSQGEIERFKKLIDEFDKRFVKEPGPKKLKLNIKSTIPAKKWEWFLQDWKMA